jgi:hypothetical protein
LNESGSASHVTQRIAASGRFPINHHRTARRKEHILRMKITVTQRRSNRQSSQGFLRGLLLRRGQLRRTVNAAGNPFPL